MCLHMRQQIISLSHTHANAKEMRDSSCAAGFFFLQGNTALPRDTRGQPGGSLIITNGFPFPYLNCGAAYD